MRENCLRFVLVKFNLKNMENIFKVSPVELPVEVFFDTLGYPLAVDPDSGEAMDVTVDDPTNLGEVTRAVRTMFKQTLKAEGKVKLKVCVRDDLESPQWDKMDERRYDSSRIEEEAPMAYNLDGTLKEIEMFF
jgi:hypothetical protein